jgi:hypothetical protein
MPAQRNHPETTGLRASDPYRHHVASGMQPPFLCGLALAAKTDATLGHHDERARDFNWNPL